MFFLSPSFLQELCPFSHLGVGRDLLDGFVCGILDDGGDEAFVSRHGDRDVD